MTNEEDNIIFKIKQLELEMKRAGLWQKEAPEWVNHFEEKIVFGGKDFAQWLQFIFIPNHLDINPHHTPGKERKMLVPEVMQFFADDVQIGKLLQLLIEIDSLL